MSVIARTLRQRFVPGWVTETIRSDQQAFAALTIGAVMLAVCVRVLQMAGTDFPLNDGGMFYQMTRDLQANGYRLPAFTSYNGGEIPFTYPPLGFYVCAILDDLTPLSLTTIFQLVPLVATCLTVVAFLALARDLVGTRLAVLASLVAFALIPRSFIWLIMGGGTTRALGFLFALVALHQAHRMWATGERRALALAALASAATVLSHLETGWFLAFSLALFAIAFGRSQRGLVLTGLLAAGTAAIVAPWFLAVVAQHGMGPFEAAQSTSGSVFTDAETRRAILITLAHGVSTGEPFFPVIGALALLGGLLTFASGRFLLPAWWVVIVFLDYRAFATYASVPVALLAGVAVSEALIPVLNRVGSAGQAEPAEGARGRQWLAVGLGLGCLLYFAAIGVFYEEPGSEQESLRPLAHEDRQAMAWVAANTSPSAAFLLMPQSAWQTDRALEWFPALTGRASVATVQGTEWLPGVFATRIWHHDRAGWCAARDSECLEDWVRVTGQRFTHVYLPSAPGGNCCESLGASLAADIRYREVYAADDVRIFERVSY